MPRKKPVLTASPPAPIDLNPRPEPVLDFPDREFGGLDPDDYAALGFLCGLEVHQQLATERKLFCRCPTGRRSTRVDMEVLRHMRPTLSEMGEYDGTALMEFKTRKEIVYLLDRDTVCTYEIDDTPPFPIDEQAVKIALEVSMLLGLDLVSELQVMRKQYLDGSIPTGFQRTAMIGVGGVIPFSECELGRGRELRIRQLTLEEDSCREVSDVGHRITFRTDRLGTPLIETVTEPDLTTPRDVAAAVRLLAGVARASGKVCRGPGAGRQDVNVSVAGSRRVELKGVCRAAGLPRLVHNEAYRHLNLLRVRAELQRRGVDPGLFDLNPADEALDFERIRDVTPVVAGAPFAPLRRALEAPGAAAWAVALPGFGGLLGRGLQPGRDLAYEFEERVRVIACLPPPCLLHDEVHREELGQARWRDVRALVRAGEGDACVLVFGPEADVETAVREVLIRATDAFVGVPSETRQAHDDGTTGFERILPGAERMYPDTDTPPLPVPDRWLEEIRPHLAERPWERAARYEAQGLDSAAAWRLARAPWADLFDALEPRESETARRLAFALEKRLVHHWRRTRDRRMPDAARLRPLAQALDGGALLPCACEAAFDRLLDEPETEAQAILARFAPWPEERVSAETAARCARLSQTAWRSRDPAARRRAAMGALQRGRVGCCRPRDLLRQAERALQEV